MVLQGYLTPRHGGTEGILYLKKKQHAARITRMYSLNPKKSKFARRKRNPLPTIMVEKYMDIPDKKGRLHTKRKMFRVAPISKAIAR